MEQGRTSGRRTAPGGTRRPRARRVRLGRPFGVPLYLSPYWPVLAAVLVVVYAQMLAHGRPGLPPLVGYAAAALFVVCLVGSILLHELGHALACRRYGVPVRAVTVELLGGYTEMGADITAPRAEAVVALAGPAVSLALAGLAGGASMLLAGQPLGRTLALQLAVCNAVVAGFNALPGLPLDGGRALRALVWARTGDARRGDAVAGWTGRVVALVCLLAGPALYGLGALTVLGSVLVALVGVGLGYSADEAIRLNGLAAAVPLPAVVDPLPVAEPAPPARAPAEDHPPTARDAATAEESR